MTFKLSDYNKFIVLLYSLVFLISENGTMDRIGPQFFVLSILNFITIGYLFLTEQYLSLKFKDANNPIFYLLASILLIFFSQVFSLFFSENIVESIFSLNGYFQFYLTLINLIFLVKNSTKYKDFFLTLIISLLLLESFYVFYQICYRYVNEFDVVYGNFGRVFDIRGFTGNINITAFSIVYKIPFLLYFLSTNKYSKIFFYPIFFALSISIIDISHLGSRGAVLCLIILLLSFMFYLFITKKSKKLILSVIFFSITSFFVSNIIAGSKVVSERISSISPTTKDGSVDQRLRYYSQIFEYVSENPFKPIGVGIYKLKSIEFDKVNISDYIIPYHSHNDFFEILIESGFIAFLSYLLIFGILIYIATINFFVHKQLFFYPIVIFFGIYLFDSSINFPIFRPVSFIFFSLIVALSLRLNEEI